MLPCQFAAWDLNKDNVIDQQEFAFDAHVDQNDVNTKLAFTKCDTNGNILNFRSFSKSMNFYMLLMQLVNSEDRLGSALLILTPLSNHGIW